MKLALLTVPYHLGRKNEGVGGAPGALLAAGALDLLRAGARAVDLAEIDRPAAPADELTAITQLNAALAVEVRRAAASGALPVVLGGDCNVALGVIAGLGSKGLVVVWFDAHGDFNTPETSPSGFLDGMPLAIACGLCHRQIWESLGSTPVAEAGVLHVGGRDLDPEEQRSLAASRVRVVSALQLGRQAPADALAPALAAIAGRGSRRRRPGEQRPLEDVFVHVDLDVLDPSVAPAVDYPAPGGLQPEELLEAVRAVGAHFRIRALSLSAFDPARSDPEGRTLGRALEVLRRLVELAAASRARVAG
jgi:arginase